MSIDWPITGTVIWGMIFELGILLGSGIANIAHNDAFSALRLDRYRHFLRSKIEGSKLTIFSIGLDRVPSREGWRKGTRRRLCNANQSFSRNSHSSQG